VDVWRRVLRRTLASTPERSNASEGTQSPGEQFSSLKVGVPWNPPILPRQAGAQSFDLNSRNVPPPARSHLGLSSCCVETQNGQPLAHCSAPSLAKQTLREATKGARASLAQSGAWHLDCRCQRLIGCPKARNPDCDRIARLDEPCSAVHWCPHPPWESRFAWAGRPTGRRPPRAGSTPQPSLPEESACAP
jgi:hypothetical protein